MAIAKTMRDQHYKNKTIRISDEVWQALKEKRQLSGKSWNLFLRNLIGLKAKKPKEKKSHD
jgi:predicted CopG family antitoxin